MAVNINADTTTGLELTSDTSGNINIQNDGTTKVAVTAPGVAVTGALSATGDITTPGVTIGAANISTPGGTVTASSFSGDGSSLTGIAGGFSNMDVFTSPGTWTNPGNVTKVKVTIAGGGGNGARSPGGNDAYGAGGGGGAAIEIIPFPTATNVPVTVGGVAGTSSFGGYCSATGGGNGANVTSGAGGVGSGGNINFTGTRGGGGNNGGSGFSPPGGSSLLGQGGVLSPFATTPSPADISGRGYGGGGSGVGTNMPAGGAGTPGVVIVEY